MPPVRRDGFTVRVLRNPAGAPAGAGFVVDNHHIATCAHVINTALGREPRTQDKPDPGIRIQVDFPMLGDPDGAPLRSCCVEAWAPPPSSGLTGGDVTILRLVGEGLPDRAGPARLIDQATFTDVAVNVFGYPGDPPRRDDGVWSLLHLRGTVGSGIIQLDASAESAVRAQRGYSGSPAVITDDAGDAVVGMFAVASNDANTRDTYAIPISWLINAAPLLGDLTVPPCPYRGLYPFTAADNEAGLFVGREEEVTLLRRMVAEHSLVVVAGPSGVGKSSLVTAALIPALEREGWITDSFSPGSLPFEALARVLLGMEQPGRARAVDDLARWADRLRSDGLAELGAQLALLRGSPILLCVDALEQILDPGTCSPETKAEFLNLVLSMHAAQTEQVRLVCTLRADFLPQLLEHPDAGARLHDQLFTVSPMSVGRLERVISEPARARGVRYEDGLVQLIAADAGDGAGLPLLEFALTDLWPHQRQRFISLTEYYEIGGVTGALRGYAERVYQKLLRPFGEERIRRVMLSLVRSRGGAVYATRRTVSRKDLSQDWEVAEALTRHRLLMLGHDSAKGTETAEIAHEALIRAWPRFTRWVDDDADFQHWLTALEERAADGDLLSDVRIGEAEMWLESRLGDIPHAVVELIHRSKSDLLRRVTELENARKKADEAARKAADAFRQAEARRLAAAAELALASRGVPLQVPIALAIESLQTKPTIEGDIATRHAIQKAPIQRYRVDHGKPVEAVAFSPDGSQVITGCGDGSARVLDSATGAEICRLEHRGSVNAAAFNSDGTKVATGSGDGSARVLDSATGAEICRLNHAGPVWAVAFSPDGSRVATASWDHSARMLDAESGAEIWRIDHRQLVRSVAYSPDGSRVATASWDDSARVLDAGTGAEMWRLDHDGPVWAVAFSPDGGQLATGSGDGALRVFDVLTGSEVHRLGHGTPVRAATFSPSGGLMVIGGGDGSARVLDVVTGAEVSRLDHDGVVNAVAFSPDGNRVVTGSGDGSARVLDVVTGAEVSRLDHDGIVNAVAFSPDGNQVITGSDDGSARVMDAVTGPEVWRWNHDGPVEAVAFSPGGDRVGTGSWDGSGRVLDAVTGALVCRIDHDGPVWAVAFSPDGSRMVTGSRDGSVRLMDAATGLELCRLNHDGPVNTVAFSPDGRRVASGSWDHTVRLQDVITQTEVWRVDHGKWVRAVAFSPDGSRVVAGGGDGSARVLDAETGTEICRLRHDGPVWAVIFSPDGSRVATGSDDRSARVFNAVTGAEICRLDHDGRIRTVAFSPDGSRVATGSGDGSARVMDALTGTELAWLSHDGPVRVVAFSPDGARVVTGSDDYTARVLDVATETELCLMEHDERVWAIALSPDGTRVTTGSSDGSARVWVMGSSELVSQAKGRLTRKLNQHERRRYLRDASSARQASVPGSVLPRSVVPRSVRLLDLWMLEQPTSEQVADGWRRCRRTTEIPLGETATGTFTLDIARDGPHMLVAGTTGAGKSEFLQTLIASLALGNTPDALVFVLIDYKGGSSLAGCSTLPHVTGFLTDVDEHLTQRALVALAAEVRYRERLLFEAACKDIDRYHAAGEPGGPLPRLVIVIDEFRFLMDQVPDFLQRLTDITARGRSLGIHLILATQRPTGVVSQDIRTNMALRVCFRVEDAADSTAVVDFLDAAGIERQFRGRGYARTERGVATLFQGAYVGGSRLGASAERRNDLDALVEAIRGTGQESPKRRIWVKPLPVLLRREELPRFEQERGKLLFGYGVEDRSAEQYQRVVALDLEAGKHLLVGGAPQSGRTTTLRTIAAGIASTQSPADVHLYVLDCDAGGLAPLARLPHCGAVVRRTEKERAARLLHRLAAEIDRRQDLLASAGFASITEQRRRVEGADRLPYMVLLLDRWEGFLTSLGQVDSGQLPELMTRLLIEGPSAGLCVVATGDRTALFRLTSQFHDRLVLRMSDAGDLLMAGVPKGAMPSNPPPGRGIIVPGGSEVQVAFGGDGPDSSAQTAALNVIISGAAETNWAPGPVPLRVDVIPRQISLRQARAVPGWQEAQGRLRPMLAVGGDELSGLGIDLARFPGFAIAGPPLSGRSTALLVIAGSLLEAGTALIGFAPRESPLRELAGRSGVTALFTDPSPDAGELKELLESATSPLAVLVDDAEALHQARVSELLAQIPVEGRARGHALVVAGTSAELLRTVRGFTAAARQYRCGLLLTPETPMLGQELFGTRLPRGAAFDRPPGRGYLIQAGHTILAQVPELPASYWPPAHEAYQPRGQLLTHSNEPSQRPSKNA